MHFEWSLSLWHAMFGAGGLVTFAGIAGWAGYATEWISQYGPVGWVASAFLGGFSFVCIYYILCAAADSRASAELKKKRLGQSTKINPLNDNFSKEIIYTNDIFSHYHQHLLGKTFRECRFVGPMVMSFGEHVRLDSPRMSECNFIVVNNGFIRGVVAFSETTFKDCEFDSVTFILDPTFAKMLKNQAKDSISLLGYPT